VRRQGRAPAVRWGSFFSNRYTRVQSGLHRESRPEVDHAEDFVDEPGGVSPVRVHHAEGWKSSFEDGRERLSFQKTNRVLFQKFVHAAGVGLVGDHNDSGGIFFAGSALPMTSSSSWVLMIGESST